MSVSANIRSTLSVAGKQFTRNAKIDGASTIAKDVTVPVALAGALTVRTSNTAGSVTITPSNTITTGARVDVYWTGGQRRGVTVGTVAGQVVPISGGLGDNLPAQGVTVQVAVAVQYPWAFVRTTLLAFGAYSQDYGQVTFTQSDGTTEIFSSQLDAGESYSWDSQSGVTNPFTADPGYVYFSHKNITAAQGMRTGALLNN